MMPFDAKNTELADLLSRLCDGEIGQADWDRLETLLLNDPAAQDLYRRFVALDVELAWRGAGRPAPSHFYPSASGPVPSVIIESSGPLQAPASTLYPFGSFVFSYAAAVVIVGIGLLIGWAYQVSITRPDQRESVHVAPPSKPADLRSDHELVFVGRVTDMVECQWADPKAGTINYAFVPLGRNYALASGLMEITYDTGVRVILQGPCTYQVESPSGGYLSQGCLTARVEKRGRGGEGETRRLGNLIVERSNSQPIFGLPVSKSPPLPLSPSPLFAVRTPTARIADLGTEFGVEVDPSGVSTAQVYQGKVELLPVGADANRGKAIRLEKNESARVEVGKDRIARVVRQPAQPSRFVRQMPKRVRIKVFNTAANLKEVHSGPPLAACGPQRRSQVQAAAGGSGRRKYQPVALQSTRSFAMGVGRRSGPDRAERRCLYVPYDLQSERDAALDGRFARAIRRRQPRAGDSTERPRGFGAQARL